MAYTLGFVRSWGFRGLCVLLVVMAVVSISMSLPESAAVEDLPFSQFERDFHEAELRVVGALANVGVLVGAMLLLRGFPRLGSATFFSGGLTALAVTGWHVVALHRWAENVSDKTTPFAFINGGVVGLIVAGILVVLGVVETCLRTSG